MTELSLLALIPYVIAAFWLNELWTRTLAERVAYRDDLIVGLKAQLEEARSHRCPPAVASPVLVRVTNAKLRARGCVTCDRVLRMM